MFRIEGSFQCVVILRHVLAQVLQMLKVCGGVRGSQGVQGRGIHRGYLSTLLETI